MIFRKAVYISIFFSFFLAIPLFAEKTESLILEYEKAKDDTTRVRLCCLIASQYESSNPDSAFLWLNKALAISKAFTNDPDDFTLYYYHGVTITSIGKLNAILSKNLDHAQQQIEEGIAIFENLIELEPGNWLERRSLQAISLSYGVLGRIAYTRGDIAKATDYFTQTLNLLELLDDKKGLAMMHNNLGVMHRLQSNYAQSLIYYQKAYDYFALHHDSVSIASVLLNIGSVSQDIGAYDKSLESYHKALDIFKVSNQKKNLASALINIGNVLVSSKNTISSIHYFRQALTLYKVLDDQKGIADVYHSLGSCLNELNDSDSAFYYMYKSKKVNEIIDNKIGLANNYHVIGEMYYKEKKLISALKNLQIALNTAEEIGINAAHIMLSIAKVHYANSEFDSALEWAHKAISESKEAGLVTIQKNAFEVLADINESMGNYSIALDYYKNYFNLYDSVLSRDRSLKFAELETLYQLEQKEKAINHLEQERVIKEIELKQAEHVIYGQKIRSYFFLGIMLMLVIILFLLYHQFKIKRKTNNSLKQQFIEIQKKNEEITAQNEMIEAQHDEMLKQKEQLKDKSEQLERFNWMLIDSIDYASNIQSALLPQNSSFAPYFRDQLTVFFPKDVVSGDFYWNYTQGNRIIIAVADCTGHGVPGGFMSMLGISTLNDLISRNITEPADMIDNLRLIIINSFKQTGEIGQQQDGMDISIISYTKGNDYIHFAGANQSLLLLRNNKTLNKYEITEHKGDKMPASYHPKMRPFNSQKISVKKEDQIYLFTDGFYHQLGGEMHIHKYGKENFKKLLQQNANMEMENQKNIIEDAFFRWVSTENDQLDDITILGFKI